jgi:ABC-2 type transport system permease protein
MIDPTLRGFIKKEFIQALRDRRMRFILLMMPLVQMTIFGVAISTEVKNIRLAAFFNAKDNVLRDVYERAIMGGWFIPAKAAGRIAQHPFELIRANKADAVLVAPPKGFTHELGRKTAPLQLLIDATNVVQAESVEAYLKAILADTVASDLKVAASPPPPIRFDVRVLFNPSLDTATFMVPGVMVMIMVITTFLLVVMGVVREKEQGTFEMLIAAPVSRTELIFGKTLPYVVIGMADLPLMLPVSVLAFHVPLRGSFLYLFFATLVFVSTIVAAGLLTSTFCANQQQASMGSFLFMFPAIMFAGIIFPIENMPPSVQVFAAIDPLSHYLILLRDIMLKGSTIGLLDRHVLALVGIAAFSITASFARFRTTLR